MSVAIRNVGRVAWSAGGTLAWLLRELIADRTKADDSTDRQLLDSDVSGEYNHRTGRLDAGNDPYGWYDED